MAQQQEALVGIDIGTSKICVVVAAPAEAGQGGEDGGAVNIIGRGTHVSEGLDRGVVIDVEATVHSIRRAVEEAEQIAECEITHAIVGVAGEHIDSFNSHGTVALKSGVVRESDVRRVLESARAVDIPPNQQVIHEIPQEFIVDRQDGISKPLGMHGVRLEARVHIVTAGKSRWRDIINCVESAGVEAMETVLEPLASAQAVLGYDERKLGVCLLDIGGGTTDVAAFANGAIQHSFVLPLGGKQISDDIAAGLTTSFAEAERIKKKFGSAVLRPVGGDGVITISGVGGRDALEISRQHLCEIIEPRMREILELGKDKLEAARLERPLPSGIVLTGGSSLLDGCVELAGEVFDAPVRAGAPLHVHGRHDLVRDPMYATGVGLVLYGRKMLEEEAQQPPWWRRLPNWFRDLNRSLE